LSHIRRIKSPSPSPLAQHIKDLGAQVNLVARLDQISPFRVIFTDFTEITCMFGKIYLVIFSDKTSKRITGWSVDFHKDTKNALRGYTMTKRYLKRMNINLSTVIVHQDQDSVFTGYEYAGTLLNDGISKALRHQLMDSSFCICFNSSIFSEVVSLSALILFLKIESQWFGDQ